MAAFRLIDPLRTFYGQSGQILAGGYLRFYEAGTTTPANVYGEKALTTNNGSQVDLDSSGRPELDIWGDADDSYFVEIYSAANVKQGEMDDVELPGGAGQTVPVPDVGEFLTGDGTNFAVATVREVPDPEGSSGKYLSNDGEQALWVTGPEDGEAGVSDVSASATGFTVGSMRVQCGSATGTSAGGRTQTKSVTFATAFASAPIYINVQPTNSAFCSFINAPSWSITASSTTGFTVKFTMGEDDSGSGFDFNTGVDFKYVAIGAK